MGIFAADFTTTDERRAKLEATAQYENEVADQHEEILAVLAGERAHSRTHTANGHAIRWTYNADGSPAKNYCDTCKNSPCVCDFTRTQAEPSEFYQAVRPGDVILYQVEGGR